MSRAFLYMVVVRGMTSVQPVYTVHRINTSRLFFSNKDGQRLPAAESADIRARLPRPSISLYPSDNKSEMEFVLFGRNKDKIVGMDYNGRTVLYNDALQAVSPLPSMKGFKLYYMAWPMSVSLPVANGLFVMNIVPFCFASFTSAGALINHEHTSSQPLIFWQPIQPPPYVKPEDDRPASDHHSVEAHTVVGESQVWISGKSYGTYSLDMKNFCYDLDGNEMRRGEWSKVGDWVLPFSGSAVYAPELNLWFGFSERDESILCAVNLQQGATQPPIVSHEWEGFTVPRARYPVPIDSFLVHLGASGRFCIAKFSYNQRGRRTAKLTGVEVTPCADGEALCLVKHKTYRYVFGKDHPICVL